MIASMSSKGQLTLPKAIRQLLHLEQGDYVQLEPKGGAVLLTKITLESDEFTTGEWKTLEHLADQHGKRYASAKEFLKDLARL